MELALIIGIAVLLLLNVVTIIFLVKQKNGNKANGVNAVETIASDNKKELESMYRLICQNNDNQLKILQIYNTTIDQRMKDLNVSTEKNLINVTEKLKELTFSISESLKQIQVSNEKKLDEMRVTVGEKLDSTLNERLNQNVKVISQQLETFITGISEVKSLSSGVVDLKNILGNIKNRGTFGEVQLGALLEQILSPSQFASQVDINSSGERVDYVIYFPGKDNNSIMLPIDAKFPMEDYKNLQDSLDRGDKDSFLGYRKQLLSSVKKEAKAIRSKYISIPLTTDFAVMYLPTESLYAEVIKEVGLFEEIQRDLRITICGPTTLSALLNSLQMGFRTLAIEKKSSEIWSLLSQFKKDFGNYVELLTKTQKKLTGASDDIESATKMSELIKKRLSKIDDIGDADPVIKLKEYSGEK